METLAPVLRHSLVKGKQANFLAGCYPPVAFINCGFAGGDLWAAMLMA